MLKLELLIDEVDYEAIFSQFGPQIAEKLKESGNPAGHLPHALIRGFLAALPAGKREQLAAELINANRGRVQRTIENLADAKGIKLRVAGAKAEVKE